MIRFLLLISITFSGAATTFQVQPIEQQIKESDGVFLGNFLGKKSVQLDNGMVATQMMFRMSREQGLQSEFFGMDEVIVHYPGGQMNNQHIRIDGLPEFNPGEKVLLFIRSIDNRYWGMNLGFGSFKVINFGHEVMLMNSIFPHDSKVGQVNMVDFEIALKRIKGSAFKNVISQAYLTVPDEEKVERAPASVEEESEGQNRTVASETEQLDNETAQTNLSVFWLMAALGILGGVFRLNRKKFSK